LHRLDVATKLPCPRRPPHSVYRSLALEEICPGYPTGNFGEGCSEMCSLLGRPAVRISFPPALSHRRTGPAASRAFDWPPRAVSILLIAMTPLLGGMFVFLCCSRSPTAGWKG